MEAFTSPPSFTFQTPLHPASPSSSSLSDMLSQTSGMSGYGGDSGGAIVIGNVDLTPHGKGIRGLHAISGSGASAINSFNSEAQDWSGLFRLLSYILISGIGSTGSLFLISALTVVSVLMVRGNSFLASLCLSHLIVTVFVVPSTAIAIMSGSKGHNPILCHYQWLATEATLIIHILSFLMISFDNWRGLGTGSHYRKPCSKFNIFLLVLCIWTTAALILTTQHVNDSGPDVCLSLARDTSSSNNDNSNNNKNHSSGTQTQRQERQRQEAAMNRLLDQKVTGRDGQEDGDEGNDELLDETTFYLLVTLVVIVVPTLTTIFFFSRSLVILKRYRMYMSQNPLNPIYFRTDASLLRSHVAAYAISLFMWTPVCVVGLLDQLWQPLDSSLIDGCWWLSLAYSCTISFLYAFTNRDFGDAFVQLFYYCCCKSHVNWVRKPTVASMHQMAASHSMGHSVPPVSVNGHHYHHHHHHQQQPQHYQHHQYPTSMSSMGSGGGGGGSGMGMMAGSSSAMGGRSHGSGMGMVAMGGGMSGGGICGGGPFRAFRQGRMTSEL